MTSNFLVFISITDLYFSVYLFSAGPVKTPQLQPVGKELHNFDIFSENMHLKGGQMRTIDWSPALEANFDHTDLVRCIVNQYLKRIDNFQFSPYACGKTKVIRRNKVVKAGSQFGVWSYVVVVKQVLSALCRNILF